MSPREPSVFISVHLWLVGRVIRLGLRGPCRTVRELRGFPARDSVSIIRTGRRGNPRCTVAAGSLKPQAVRRSSCSGSAARARKLQAPNPKHQSQTAGATFGFGVRQRSCRLSGRRIEESGSCAPAVQRPPPANSQSSSSARSRWQISARRTLKPAPDRATRKATPEATVSVTMKAAEVRPVQFQAHTCSLAEESTSAQGLLNPPRFAGCPCHPIATLLETRQPRRFQRASAPHSPIRSRPSSKPNQAFDLGLGDSIDNSLGTSLGTSIHDSIHHSDGISFDHSIVTSLVQSTDKSLQRLVLYSTGTSTGNRVFTSITKSQLDSPESSLVWSLDNSVLGRPGSDWGSHW